MPTRTRGVNASQGKTASRKSASTAAVAGGGIGSGIVAIAQKLPEPYQVYLSILAPALAAVITAALPPFAAWAKLRWDAFWDWRKTCDAINGMRAYCKRQRKRLKDKDLPDSARAYIEARIVEVEQAIARKDFESISVHVQPEAPAAQSERTPPAT